VDPYLREVLDLLLRWVHVIAGIAWIGASFYFVRLDLGLRPPAETQDAERGVAGEFWGVHGGGFYRSQKYRVAPERLPEPLHWFRWEAYATWLSGFALLVVLYYFDADVRLIDPAVAELEPWQAILISVGSLAAGWIAYDLLCRALASDVVLAAALAGLVALAAWALGEAFAPRAAYLQLGAVLGTIMAANVLFSIIPAHRELVRAKQAGREPDPTPGIAAKRRSVHNNYLTLPVLFTMIAGHFPFTYGSGEPWLVLVAILGLSALLRHFFNLWHAGRRAWAIPAAVAGAAVALAFVLEPDDRRPPAGARAVPFARVQSILARRCLTCHAGAGAPNGVRLETRAQIEARAAEIERVAVQTRVMPPGNSTGMTEAERGLLAVWLASR
jgi:uncharacterized membrane protein